MHRTLFTVCYSLTHSLTHITKKSGMFAATNAAATLKEHLQTSSSYLHKKKSNKNQIIEVHVFESTSNLMSKVLISGGGRCNVLHDTTKPLPKILSSYPRGQRELNGLYSKHFTPDDARSWFVDRGVVLKTESDGRMFPITDKSQTIADCIYDDAMKNGVIVRKGDRVVKIDVHHYDPDHEHEHEHEHEHDTTHTNRFDVITQNQKEGEHNFYNCIIMATGSAPKGHDIINQLNVGHHIVKPIPSLFTLNVDKAQIKDDDGVLYDLAGLSLQNARLTLKVAGTCTTTTPTQILTHVIKLC